MMKPFCIEEGEWVTWVIVGSNNSKTGNAVTTYTVPKPVRGVSIFQSVRENEPCPKSCPRSLASGASFHKCYARKTPLMGLSSSIRGVGDIVPLSVDDFLESLELATRVVPFVRLGGYGDPGITPKTTRLILDFLQAVEVPYVGYTHIPSNKFKGELQLSVDSSEALYYYSSLGWKTAIVTQDETTCPAQIDGITTCGSCRKCDGSKEHIIFKEH